MPLSLNIILFVSRKHVGHINHIIKKRGFKVLELKKPVLGEKIDSKFNKSDNYN